MPKILLEHSQQARPVLGLGSPKYPSQILLPYTRHVAYELAQKIVPSFSILALFACSSDVTQSISWLLAGFSSAVAINAFGKENCSKGKAEDEQITVSLGDGGNYRI